MADRYYVWPDTIPPKHPLTQSSGKTNIDTPENRETSTSPVRSMGEDKTDQGIFDMMGNVREWCRNRETKGDRFEVRGGSYVTFASNYSNFGKQYLPENEMKPDLGFRIVVELPALPPKKVVN
jgi:formylglycine-generating enzyme required for sulfatase activity